MKFSTAPPDVVFWTADRGGSRYYRCDEPARALQLLGYRTLVTPQMCESWRRARVIVGQRVITEHQTRVWQHMIDNRLPGQRFVFDADDDWFSIDQSADPRVYELYQRQDIRDNIVTNAGRADAVVVCSPRLADVFRTRVPGRVRVEITPNTLPARLCRPLKRRPGIPRTVGWAGSPGAAADLAMVAPALQRAARAGMQVHLVGISAMAVRGMGIDHPNVRVTEWVHGTAEYIEAIDFDVWVAPYRDTEFNRAKYPTKVMESAVRAVPVIVSAVGEYLQHLGPGVTVVDGDDPDDWYRAITWFCSVGKWKREAGANPNARYLTECNAPVWERVLLG